MDCANDTAQRVHRGMVHVIMGDIVLLSQTALKDLGVIPKTFPTIGEFGGEEQQGDGHGRFEVDANYTLKYIGPSGAVQTVSDSHRPLLVRAECVRCPWLLA